MSPALAGGSLTTAPPGKSQYIYVSLSVYVFISFYICIYIEIYFKELAHAIVGASKSEICRASQQARSSGRG